LAQALRLLRQTPRDAALAVIFSAEALLRVRPLLRPIQHPVRTLDACAGMRFGPPRCPDLRDRRKDRRGAIGIRPHVWRPTRTKLDITQVVVQPPDHRQPSSTARSIWLRPLSQRPAGKATQPRESDDIAESGRLRRRRSIHVSGLVRIGDLVQPTNNPR